MKVCRSIAPPKVKIKGVNVVTDACKGGSSGKRKKCQKKASTFCMGSKCSIGSWHNI